MDIWFKDSEFRFDTFVVWVSCAFVCWWVWIFVCGCWGLGCGGGCLCICLDFFLGSCDYGWGLLVGLDFWLWLSVSCALFFWIFCVVVGGVDGSGIRVCRWWWRWNWVWVWVSCSLCRVTQVREEDSWKRLIGGLHRFGKKWT